MSAGGTQWAAQQRCLRAGLLLVVALLATACGSGFAAQAAVSELPGRSLDEVFNAASPARGDAVAGQAAPELSADLVANVETTIYRVGQTATTDSLRVTLDKVAATAGKAGNWPDANYRFLLVYVTVENTGVEAQALTSFSTSMTDMAGTHYFVEPNAGYLSAIQSLEVSIPRGGRVSGIRAYMLPANAGDLIWIWEDAGRNRASFAIDTTEIVALR